MFLLAASVVAVLVLLGVFCVRSRQSWERREGHLVHHQSSLSTGQHNTSLTEIQVILLTVQILELLEISELPQFYPGNQLLLHQFPFNKNNDKSHWTRLNAQPQIV